MDIVTFLLGLFAIVIFFIWIRRHDPSLPPTPASRLPIFGHLLQIGSNPRLTFKKWRKQCGDLYSVYLGQTLVVVLNGYDLLKEALVTNEETFSDRPRILFDAANFSKTGIGLAFSNGDTWKEQRAITMSNFRKLGVGTNVMSERISEIAAINNDLIAQKNGQPIDLDEIITPSIANGVCSIMFGRCFDYNDDDFVKAIKFIRGIIVDGDARNLANYFPVLANLPGDLFKLKSIKQRGAYVINSFLRVNIQKCESHNIDEHDHDTFINRYISEGNKKRKAGQSTVLIHENLRTLVYDLFGAGVETTSTTMKWCILYFLHYPDFQDKVYREIENEVGTDRPPTMTDKNQLSYLNAMIQETQRLASIFPLSVMHMCSKSTFLRGYTIPKGTYIIPNMDSVLHDKKIWGEDANMFRPERFLDDNGKVKHPEEFIPFSVGKRSCPGATLAKMQLFLFLSRMVQRFKFVPSEPGRLPSLVPEYGVLVCPAKFQVRAIERSF